MTPDQIFKAEQKLRELKKCQAALSAWSEFVFGVELSGVRGAVPDFPYGNGEMSNMLKDLVQRELEQRITNIRLNLKSMGVDIQETFQ